MDHVLQNLKEVVAERPVDIIIKQIKDLLITGQLKPGDRLPPDAVTDGLAARGYEWQPNQRLQQLDDGAHGRLLRSSKKAAIYDGCNLHVVTAVGSDVPHSSKKAAIYDGCNPSGLFA